jgi:hypothetical protein
VFPLQVRVPIVEVMICVRRSATREEHRHDRGVGGSDLVCAFPQHFAVEAILAHYSSVVEGCRRARRTRTIFFSSFVPNSIRLPFKGSVDFGRSLSRVEVGNGLVEGVLVKWAVSLLLVLLLFFRRIYRRGGVLLPRYLLGFLEAVLVSSLLSHAASSLSSPPASPSSPSVYAPAPGRGLVLESLVFAALVIGASSLSFGSVMPLGRCEGTLS